VEAGFKRVITAAPACRQAAGRAVHFQNFNVITTLTRVDGGAQSRYAAADDNYLFGVHIRPLRSFQ
jgi:hypothetical protein